MQHSNRAITSPIYPIKHGIHSDYKQIISSLENFFEDDYYKYVFRVPLDYYRQRIEMVDCTGYENVLDAGCGYGQWSLVLSEKNSYVTGIDHNDKMIEASRALNQHLKRKNVNFMKGSLPRLDFKSHSFDFVWCWSVLMFVNRTEAFKEFYRILKPGGRIFIGAMNSPGRVFYKLRNSLSPRSFNFQRAVSSLITLIEGGKPEAIPNHMSIGKCSAFCKNNGFKLIACALDGEINQTKLSSAEIPPLFGKTFKFESNIEFLAEKL